MAEDPRAIADELGAVSVDRLTDAGECGQLDQLIERDQVRGAVFLVRQDQFLPHCKVRERGSARASRPLAETASVVDPFDAIRIGGVPDGIALPSGRVAIGAGLRRFRGVSPVSIPGWGYIFCRPKGDLHAYSYVVAPTRSRSELMELLREQLRFLELSNTSFDSGHLIEAKRLAVTLRVLFRQTASSHALVMQLGLDRQLSWVDTAGRVDPENLLSVTGLVQMRFTARDSTQPAYVAKLGSYPQRFVLARHGRRRRGNRAPFEEWWNTPVMRDSKGREFSRWNLVNILSNKEGGAHVDPKPHAGYVGLSQENSLGWYLNGDKPLESNPVFPSVRQISYEVLESFRQQSEYDS
ncbi:hypothetical protein QEN42_21135 [Gordonia alkanivorans]|uniref:hypothetical protein n=1 Tax=Gordonia alkanivorans TaxID=84096 RepID=UPI002449AEC7|nr:hypothetical protein [Gordonia alkanivorans]MDH3052339.1 hypothetical protein [Gordonia alkanivorans]